ncbi:MAG: endonuclease [Balneolaceae bacterium]
MKFLHTLAVLFIAATQLFAQTDQIFPTQTGAQLIDELQANYSVTNPLGYNRARDAMYSTIDNKDGDVTGVYSGYTITTNSRGDAYNKGINTEHTWPQGLFDSSEPMRGDIHHLFPTRIDVNGARSNFPFAEIPDNQTTKWFTGASNQTSIPTSNIDDYSELLNGTSFEPREDHKGNVARAIFYFWTIYQDNPKVADDASFFNGMKDVLLVWHNLDPVDEAEVERSIGAETAQGNRNPFVHDTTLVRRAYFGGDANTIINPPNPVTGKISNISMSKFNVEYAKDMGTATAIFDIGQGFEAKDTAGVVFNLGDYSEIELAKVIWIAGSEEGAYTATNLEVILFEKEPAVISNPLRGELKKITDASFEITYNPETKNAENPLYEASTQESQNVLYNGMTVATGPEGETLTLSEYSSIEDAIVWWTNTSADMIADSIKVVSFGETDTTVVIGSGNSSSLIISGVFDATLTGGTPKGVELYAVVNIEDLSVFGIGSANNGGGSDGVEFKLSGSVAEGDYLYIATEEANFKSWFGFNPDLVDNMAVAINGDDAVELFYDSTRAFAGAETVVDVFGNINGTESSWRYTDGWAYRKDLTGPDGNVFYIDNWTFSGVDAFEGFSSNSAATNPMPIGTYYPGVINNSEKELQEKPSTIVLNQNYPNPFNPQTIISYSLSKAGLVQLKVFNILGQEVSTLVNKTQIAGNYSITFDAANLPSGVYLYQLNTNGVSSSRKMLLIK